MNRALRWPASVCGTGLLALALCASAGDAALIDQTRLVGQLTLARAADFAPGRPAQRSAAFNARREGGPVWALVYAVVRLEDGAEDGEALFEVGVTDVAMHATDTVLGLRTQHMQQPAPGQWLPRQAEEWVSPLNLGRLKPSLSADDYQALDRPQGLRHIVALKRYAVPAGVSTSFGIQLVSASKLTPLFVDVVVGQGPLPRELEAFRERTNGSFFYRYRQALGLIATALLLLLLLLRMRR